MVAPAMGAAMTGPEFFFQENGVQHGGYGFYLRLSTFWGSRRVGPPHRCFSELCGSTICFIIVTF